MLLVGDFTSLTVTSTGRPLPVPAGAVHVSWVLAVITVMPVQSEVPICTLFTSIGAVGPNEVPVMVTRLPAVSDLVTVVTVGVTR